MADTFDLHNYTRHRVCPIHPDCLQADTGLEVRHLDPERVETIMLARMYLPDPYAWDPELDQMGPTETDNYDFNNLD